MEELRKVTAFSELKTGMIVVVTNCCMCHKAKCRKMLGNFGFHEVWFENKLFDCHAFECIPSCDSVRSVYLEKSAVDEGRVYVVEDGLEDMDQAEDEAVKPKTKEKVNVKH